MLASEVNLVVLDDLRTYLPENFSRSADELEALILKDGRIIDPIVYWVHDGQKIVVDGMRRLSIATKHPFLQFDVTEKEFSSMRDVKHWMDCNQSARRNLQGHDRIAVVERMDEYLSAEKEAGRFDGSIDQEIAKRARVSRRQVQRDRTVATAIKEIAEPLRKRFESGDLKLGPKALVDFATLPEQAQKDLVAQFERGEHASLSAAVLGDDETDGKDGDPVDFKKEKAKPGKKPPRPVDPSRLPEPTGEYKYSVGAEPEPDVLATLPIEKPAAKLTRSEIEKQLIKDIGMLHKHFDELNELVPDAARRSSVNSHIANLRNIAQKWAKDVA